MLSSHSLLAWIAISVALVLTPGPDTMLVAGHAARRGFRAGMAAALGILLGGVWYMALCGFGFLSVLNAVPQLFLAVKITGALYLGWLGVQLLRGAIRGDRSEARPVAAGAPFRQGFLSTVLNPKVAVVFLAALPQFVGTGPQAPYIGMGLIAIAYALGFCWCTAIAGIATHAGRRVGQSPVMRWFEGLLGTLFLGLAGRLALARN